MPRRKYTIVQCPKCGMEYSTDDYEKCPTCVALDVDDLEQIFGITDDDVIIEDPDFD